MIIKRQIESQWNYEIHHNENKNADGSCQRWRQYGKIKTWKRNLDRFEMPIKHGLSVYAKLNNENADQFHLTSECTNEKK